MTNELTVIPMRAICDRELPSTALKLLGYLSAMTDLNGVCWPSNSTIARSIGIGVTTIQRNKLMLEQSGYIKSVPRYRDNGQRTSQACQVLYDTKIPSEMMDDQPEQKTRLRASSKAPSESFLTWYAAYPRRISRGAALKAYNKVIKSGATEGELLEGAIQYTKLVKQKNTEEKFIPHPATWLNNEKWLDDEVVAVAPPPMGDLAPEAL